MPQLFQRNPQKIIMQRQTIAGSLIGGIAETMEVLEFCALHGTAPEVEIIPVQDLNKIYSRVKNKKARYRYVLDIASLDQENETKLSEIASVGHRLLKKKAKIPVPEVHAGEERMDFEPAWNRPSAGEDLTM